MLRSQAVWRVPLRRAFRAVDCAVERMESSGRVINAALRFGADRPYDRVRQLCLLSGWIDQAHAQLERAVLGLQQWTDEIARAPQHLAADSALLFLDATLRCMAAMVLLDQISACSVQASAQIVQETREWAESAAAAPAAQPIRRASPRHPRVIQVLVRRSPAAFATVADAARKVCRGRAPPLSQTARSIRCN